MNILQIFLVINVFILGGALTLAMEHIWLHYHPREFNADPNDPNGGVHLPMNVKERLLRVAETDYQDVLNRSIDDFKGDLRDTTSKINDQLTQISGDILGEEMDRYKATLKELRAKAEQTRSQAQTDVERHQAELESLILERQKMMETKFIERHTALERQAEAEIMAAKNAYIARIDTKLAEAVTSFLSNTLQYNADLGAQESYLLSELEKYKNELIQEVSREI